MILIANHFVPQKSHCVAERALNRFIFFIRVTMVVHVDVLGKER